MDFYNELIYLSDEEIDCLVEKKVEELDDGITRDDEYIGYKANNNYTQHEIEENGNYFVETKCFYSGYISENTKIIFGMTCDTEGRVSNRGDYYYLDNHEYINKFCKYISKFDISNEYELFEYLLDFLKEYFGCIEQIDRSEMFKLIVDNNGNSIKPLNEHGLSWFKGKGNAMCSDYSVVAQNILSIFGIESYFVMGVIKIGDKKPGGHAFNLLKIYDKEGNEKNLLVDFFNHVKTYDIDFKYIAPSPFIGELEIIDQEFVDEFVLDEKHLTFEDYNYMVIGNTLARIAYDRNRDYYIGSEISCYTEYDVKKCKEKKRDI